MINSNYKSIFNYIILTCFTLYAFTFLLDMKINFLTTSFIFCIILYSILKKNNLISINLSKDIKTLNYVLFIFLILILISTIYTESSLSTYRSRFLSPLLGLFIFYFYPFKQKHLILIFLSFSFILLINSLIIIYQFSQGNIGRPTGMVGNHYMFLAVFNTLILPIIFCFCLSKNVPSKLRIFFAITLIFNIPAIVFENTRIVWISLFISFMIVILLSKINIKRILLIFISIFISIFILLQISPNSLTRLKSISDISYQNQSNYERLLMWQSATNMFIDHPIYGVGIDNYYNEYIHNYRSPLSREKQHHPHNVLLTFLSETGLLGTFGYVTLFLYLFYHSIKTYIKNYNIFALAYLACLISFTINSLTDSIFSQIGYGKCTTFFWIITGLYFYINNHISIKYKKYI